MMHRLRLTAIVVAVAACLAASHASIGGVQVEGSGEDVEAIKKVIIQMTDGMNKKNAATIAAVYTPDADLVTVFGQHLRGSAEIERVMGAFFQSGLSKSDVRTRDMQIRFIRPDVALVHVTNELSGATDTKGNIVPTLRELSIRVCVKSDDQWRVAAFHNTMVREAGHK
jgi:uncharacterized protein (TIGR02246 family)